MAVLFIAVNSCKKNDKESEQPVQPDTQNKWMVTTIAGDGTEEFLNGWALLANLDSVQSGVPFKVIAFNFK